ncbi:MAG: peptide-methionine (S)-S-oxide reductase MsrA [Bacteroidales bacterium]|nr:peptide-methionine (S)-S-oxide reductase MsrA [Bacteroidales bacterium]MBK9358383.1 peptide-methionine (S)-S-oxide reductase MsrA [Bacteroidales bacterium]
MNMTNNITSDTATFGGGCFWCTEAIFLQLKGVIRVESGYSGGTRPNPTYEQVCSGATGHAEVTQIVFDPAVIGFEELLEVFWKTHDPTTLNRQGADVGTQYRSVIFYHDEKQRELAESYKSKLGASGAWDNPIVTEISPFKAFYKAEDYHQNYYNNNKKAPYCTFVIGPKLEKFEKVFGKRFEK